MALTTRANPTLEEIRGVIADVGPTYRLCRVRLFGSYAHNRANNESDIDLVVEFDPGARVGLLEMADLKQTLEKRLGRSVDLVSGRALERSTNPYRRRAILNSAVTLYG
ncbi:MAG: hypothetical protein GC164_06790 [Phycisphaera sp.]|nr:hypothetical protein [Phycisphaera sp.]